MSYTVRTTTDAIPSEWRRVNAKFLSALSSVAIVKRDGIVLNVAKYTRPVGQRPDGKPRVQWWVWYPNGQMWSSFGKTRQDAVIYALVDWNAI